MRRMHELDGRKLLWCAALGLALAAGAAGCGGAAGGTAGSGGAGRGLVLLAFEQDGLDNVSLNTRLELRFSDAVSPASVTSQTIQIRSGGDFGRTVAGTFIVEGSRVIFEPHLAGLCDLSDSGLQPGLEYRVQLLGHPEEFSVRNAVGQPLRETITRSFRTRVDTDPDLFEDDDPGNNPTVVSSSPENGDEAVRVEPGNRIVLTLSENLDPCTITADSVTLHMAEVGVPGLMALANGGAGPATGFSSDGTLGGLTSDQDTLDPLSWGAAGTTTFSPLQRVLAVVELQQQFGSTQIVITPMYGYSVLPGQNRSLFPENALLVVRVNFDVTDFGGSSITPLALAFTTENLAPQDGSYGVDNRGETPWDSGLTTASLNENAPGILQAYMLFSGDGDNGPDPYSPTLPQVGPTCLLDRQGNKGSPTDFDEAADAILDTGASRNTCVNTTDGSFAVVWEFSTFRIRNGVTVRVIGVNPAIILVQGDVVIDAGGRLLVRGDGQGTSPQGRGEGGKNATTTAGCAGGKGVAGGGDGGASLGGNGQGVARVGGHGKQGYYHTSATGPLAADVGTAGGTGGGHGNISAHWTSQTNPNNRNAPSGGGGGHAEAGKPGTSLGSGTAPTRLDSPLDGVAGGAYGDTSDSLRVPEAGSGGGAGGEVRPFSGNAGRGPGGGGGAGGGFIDLTSGGDIIIMGTLDAAGSVGGSNPGGNFNPNYSWQPGVGGGGGGSGGGIRLLTPNDIVLGAGAIVTAAGGAGGGGGASQGTSPPVNNGGNGGSGRIALEDSNSLITGLAAAAVTPSEGDVGFYRGAFDATRFQGGGLSPRGVTGIFAVGPRNPIFVAPVQVYPTAQDFIVGAPVGTTPGAGKTVMLIEARGYQMLPDGTADETGAGGTPPTAWHTVGHFTDSGVPDQPTWVAGQPPLAEIGGAYPAGNLGVFGIGNLDTCEYIQLRVTMYLASTIGATDPGTYLDLWTIRFTSNQ